MIRTMMPYPVVIITWLELPVDSRESAGQGPMSIPGSVGPLGTGKISPASQPCGVHLASASVDVIAPAGDSVALKPPTSDH